MTSPVEGAHRPSHMVRIFQTSTEAEREEVFSFRYRVYALELRKGLSGIDHARKRYVDELDDCGVLLYARDMVSGQVVGTVRRNDLSSGRLPDKLAARLRLGPMIEAFGEERVSYSSAFMVDPTFRGKTVASLLAMGSYRDGICRGIALDVCIAELGLVHLYHQLGYRTYEAPFRTYAGGGLRVPLVLAPFDQAWLEKVESPFRHLLPSDKGDGGATAVALRGIYPEWQDPAVTPLESRALWAALAHQEPDGAAQTIFDGFSQDQIQDIVGSVPTVSLSRGKRLYRGGEHEAGMAYVMSGRLGLALEDSNDPHFVTVLGPGQLLGEMSVLTGGDRTSTLVALEKTEVLLLPANLLDRLEKKDLPSAYRMSRNLCYMLAQRLHSMNIRVLGLYDRVKVSNDAFELTRENIPDVD
ncbi:MAG: cyclic nucleotide-binding domain-containing protein [Deltaproteobacteria bacterium]|nr:cyclic nucleotide-binding domain-containing protein [Deltaproteobacteria bacterium]